MKNSVYHFLLILALFLVAPKANAFDPINDLVIPIFAGVKEKRLDSIQHLLADDAMILAMFNPTGSTSQKSIRKFPLKSYYQIVVDNYQRIEFTNRTYSVTNDGKVVWMEANGDLVVASTGKPYNNRYVFKIMINDEGKVQEIREWVNTVTLTQQGVTANVSKPKQAKKETKD